jgi:hypothetical protein
MYVQHVFVFCMRLTDSNVQLGQGTLLTSFDLMDNVAHAAQFSDGEPYLALRKCNLLEGAQLIIEEEEEEASNTSSKPRAGGRETVNLVFGSERERDEWLLAIVRWQQALIARHTRPGPSTRGAPRGPLGLPIPPLPQLQLPPPPHLPSAWSFLTKVSRSVRSSSKTRTRHCLGMIPDGD